MPKSYAQQITDAKVMTDALRNNSGNVTKIDAGFISDLDRIREEVERLNSEQEKLKADLKTKTQKYIFAKKRVKVDIPQAGWKEFGIDASK